MIDGRLTTTYSKGGKAMPYASGKQERFMEGCRHSPKHMKGKCPDDKTLSEFHTAEKAKGQKAFFKGKRK